MKPNIFTFDNYRTFLRSTIEHLRASDSKISYRALSKKAGLKSSNYFILIINGKRNLSLDTIDKISGAFSLNQKESSYFKNLVFFNQATTTEERQLFAEQLFKTKEYKRAHPIAESQFNYYTNWYYIAIRELVVCRKFVEKSNWISKQLSFKVTSDQIEIAIKDLENLGLLCRNKAGALIQSENNISTSDEVTSVFIARYHLKMIEMAGESIGAMPKEHRDITCVTLGFSAKHFQKLKALSQKFKNELVALANEEKELDSVYQFNFQLFPLAKINEE